MNIRTVSIIENRSVSEQYFELVFDYRNPDTEPQPGMFFTVKIDGVYGPVLRKPFAFSGWDAEHGTASALIEKRGNGTRWLAGLKSGDTLDILGPLGNGFSFPERGVRPILAAGGIGLGPMLYFANVLHARSNQGLCEAPLLIAGFRTQSLIPTLDFPAGTLLCTDDGSTGFKGTVLDCMLSLSDVLPKVIFACGPSPMLGALARYAASLKLPYEASVEQWMACGIGACMGCAVPMLDGSYQRACADGPVFNGLTVDWEKLI